MFFCLQKASVLLSIANKFKNSRFSLLKIDNRIWNKVAMNTCGGTNSSGLKVATMLVHIVDCPMVMASRSLLKGE